MSTAAVLRLTSEEYLKVERAAKHKSEYCHGEMFAMAGASPAHNLIAANLIALLHDRLKSSPCLVFTNDMRVKVESTGLYAYPDVVVTCDKPRMEDVQRDTLLNPTLLVEVLSKSTESYHRGIKAGHYRQIPSLQEYLIGRAGRPAGGAVCTPGGRSMASRRGDVPRRGDPSRHDRWRPAVNRDLSEGRVRRAGDAPAAGGAAVGHGWGGSAQARLDSRGRAGLGR